MNEMIKEVQTFDGNVLGIGINNKKLENALLKNPKILNCDLLSNMQNKEGKTSSSSSVTINIRELKKVYKHKTIDYFLCNLDDVEHYINYILRDGIFLTKKKIWFYTKKGKQDVESLYKKCLRYQKEIVLKEKNDSYFLSFTKVKKNYFVFLFYFFVDEMIKIVDKFSELLER